MRNEYTAHLIQDGEWFIAHSADVPGANSQGRTEAECLANLADAIELILADRGGGWSGEIVVRAEENPRAGWEDGFAEMHARGDDLLLDEDQLGNSSWDDEEWAWE